MRTSFTPTAIVEAAVTVAAALLLTFAGFEMLADLGRDAPALAAHAAAKLAA